ncbi:MAG TPA: AbrB/MazE/SpoVT family DNA-binding domain-containing protein [Anaerolineales bacterium]|jgi:AbrB family looped-hinge helix DNA binding protein|nr:AbrB/MazE/SpoVT family DNA-binding domain-containing protein [Anaerolineales bacterium]
MLMVTVSPKFQVVIPKNVRRAMGLRPGQKVQVIHHGNRIELVPLRSVKSARGMLRGMDTTIESEPDREL